ncbi:MAG TPA: hypothetical protein ENN17_12070 [bacterium]|nr:hypothetical protein [bacterium]
MAGLIFMLSGLVARGQDTLEEMLADSAEETAPDLEELTDFWRASPIDLNGDPRRVLESFPLISRDLADRILAQRSRAPFPSFSAFITRLNLDGDVWRNMAPFFQTETRKRNRGKTLELRVRLARRMPDPEGFRSGKFTGSPYRIYQRILFSPHPAVRGGFLFDKDPGEKDWADHRVGFLEFRTPDGRGQLLAGHFLMEVGQGLVFWGPYRLGAGADPLLPFRIRAGGVKGYRLADETRPMFGLSAAWRAGRVSFQAFHAVTPRDARLDEDGVIVSLPVTGLHRTASEREVRARVKEGCGGASVTLSFASGQVGVSGYTAAYDRDVVQPGRRRSGAFGVHYAMARKGLRLSGEAAVSRSGGRACIANQTFKTDRVEWGVSLRVFSDAFHNPYGNAFCAKANTNERGALFGVRFDASPSASIGTYLDVYRRPAPASRFPLPSEGSVWFLHLKRRLSRRNTLTLLFKRKEDPAMGEGRTVSGRTVPVMHLRVQRQIRIELTAGTASGIRIRTRAEWTEVVLPGLCGEITAPAARETGFLVYEDIRLRLNRAWMISGRWIFYGTDSYDARVYVYEQDVTGAFPLAMLYGQGVRQYLVVVYRPREEYRISFKYGETYRDRVESWGSGPDRITGDVERKWTLQLDVNFRPNL